MRLKLRTSLSHMPPWCGALGWLNLHLMPLWASSAAILKVFHFSMFSRSSFSATTKLVPLSDQIMAGVPRRATKRSTLITHELASIDGTISTSLLGSPTHSNVKRAEVVDPGVYEGRRLVCESFYWEVSHDWLDSDSSELSACDAVGFN